jgi:hypothetical protein
MSHQVTRLIENMGESIIAADVRLTLVENGMHPGRVFSGGRPCNTMSTQTVLLLIHTLGLYLKGVGSTLAWGRILF